MKKKILSFVLALCLIIPCAIMFSACDKKEEPDNRSLATIISEAEVGSTIKLQKDYDISEQIVVNKEITIDLNGHTINNTDDVWDTTDGKKDWSLISVQEGGDLTIKNGTLDAKEGDCYAIDVRHGATLTITSGTYIGNVTSIYVLEGEAYINGGIFDIKQISPQTEDSRYTLNCYDANYGEGTANIYVTGGVFANYNPDGSISENPTAPFVAEGYEVEVGEADGNGDIWYTVVAIAE